MDTLCLKGRVYSGVGEGARFVSLPWVKKQIEEKLSFSPYPGTLNIRLTRESTKLKEALAKAPGIRILPASGNYAGKLFKASLMSSECAVIFPEIPLYPEDVIEAISAENLRKKLNLVDGNLCEIEVMF